MPKITLDELIEERTQKAGECYMLADAHKSAGLSTADAWKISAEYAAATADFLRELSVLKSH